MDLDRESRHVLEFDAVLGRVASFAATALGRDEVAALAPRTDAAGLQHDLETLRETLRFLDEQSRLVPGQLPDPRPVLQPLAVAGVALEPGALRDLAAVLEATSDLRAELLELPQEAFPELYGLGAELPDLWREARAVLDCVDGEGNIADSASPELRRIRASRSRVGQQLHGMLEGLLRDPDLEPVIQDEFITRRNDRYVIPMRTDAPRPLKGIIHASSSSGATRFIEPLESVEMNNELVRLSDEERDELHRVLLRWTDAFRERRDEVAGALESLARVDALQARALFARDCGAVLPEVGETEDLLLEQVRHPLLDLQLRAAGQRCVPLTLHLEPADQVLVLSGPNTGGKTVALKTLGLVVLMAQSGVPVPARRVRTPLYRQLRADIGDHQSIEANLSTYSAHIRSVAGFLRVASPPGLFLFDEIGGGTDPSEGAALAEAILEALQQPGMTAVATTHQQQLKVWALSTPGALAAAMEFDVESLRPTFRLLPGAAGESAGLEIAARLGLAPSIVDRARERLGPEGRVNEGYARRMGELTRELEEQRERLMHEREAVVEEQRKLRERAERAENRRREQVASALDGALEEFRRSAAQEIDGIRESRERAAAERARRRADGRLAHKLADTRAAIAPEPRSAEPGARLTCAEEGQTVYVRSLCREGTVLRVRGQKIEVQVGGMACSTVLDDLRLLPTRRPATSSAVPLRSGGDPALAPTELKLIGVRVDDAIEQLDRYLDAATLSGHAEVRVIHGHGTGRLRRALREFLRGHAQVVSIRPGRSHEGGDGATVVRLS